jgi:hypothetical protein
MHQVRDDGPGTVDPGVADDEVDRIIQRVSQLDGGAPITGVEDGVSVLSERSSGQAAAASDVRAALLRLATGGDE